MTFEELGLAPHLVDVLAQQNITEPMDIQLRSYPILVERKDAWLSSATGSGKTLAYLLPALTQLDASSLDLQLVIMAPTHELVIQIADVVRDLCAKATPKVRVQALVGNSPVKRQKEKLKLKPHVVVGSLGRMLELMEVKKLKMNKCRTVVVDEADRMLLEKTIPDIETFISSMPSEGQVIFASASEQNDALATARRLRPTLEHVQAEVKPLDESVDHFFLRCDHHRKDDTVRQLLNALKAERIIVFLHRNEGVLDMNEMLSHQEFQVVGIHGQCDKFERQKALTQFRKGQARVLIASDVAARGLDIKGVDAIVNLDLPSQPQDYVHRVGRTGRAGATGISISLVAPNEMPILKRYKEELGIELAAATLARGQFNAQN